MRGKWPVAVLVLLAAALAAAVLWGVATYRGVAAGTRDALVARIVRCDWVKSRVRAWFGVEYDFASLHVGLDQACGGWRVNLNQAWVHVPGVLHARAGAVQLCGLQVFVRDTALGGTRERTLLTAAQADSGALAAQGITWSNLAGRRLLTVDSAAAQLSPIRSTSAGIRVLPGEPDDEITVAHTTAGGVELHPDRVGIASVSASGIRLRAIEQEGGRWNLEGIQPALQSGGDELLALARGAHGWAGERLRDIQRWSGWLPWLPWIGAAALFLLFLLFARGLRWWQLLLLIPAVLLTFPALRARDRIAALRLPAFPAVPTAVSIARAQASDIVAGVKLAACPAPDTALARVDHAEAANIRLPAFETAAARGTVETRFLAPRWQPITFDASLRGLTDFRARVANRDGSARLAGSGDRNLITLTSLAVDTAIGLFIREGGGAVKLQPDVDASLVLRKLGGRGATVDRAQVHAMVPGLCRTGASRVAASVDAIRYTAGELDLTVASAQANAARPALDRISIGSVLSGLAVRHPSASITVPRIASRIEGATSADALPRWFRGTAAATVSRADGSTIFETPQPIALEADLDRERIAVRAGLGRFTTDAGPSALELESTRAEAEWLRATGLAWKAEAAGRVRLPELPATPLTPRTITADRLDTTGTLRAIPAMADLRADADALREWSHRAIPALPSAIAFTATASGRDRGPVAFALRTAGGAEIAGTAEASLEKLLAPDARLELLHAGTRLRGLRTGGHGGNLDLDTTLRYQPKATHVELTGGAYRGTVAAVPGQLTLNLESPLSLHPVLPFLAEAGIDLNGVELPAQAHVASLTARYEGRAVRGYTAAAILAPGPLARIDFRKLGARRYLESATVTAGSVTGVQLDSVAGTLRLNAPAVTLDLNSGALQTTLGATLRAALGSEPFPDYAWLRRPFEWAADLRGSSGLETAPVTWRTQSTGVSIALEPQKVTAHLSSQIDVAAREAPVRVNGRVDTDIALSPHAGHLVVDSRSPVDVEASWDGVLPGPRRVRFDRSVLLTLTDTLRPAASGNGLLFDRAFYDKLWAELPHRDWTLALGLKDQFAVHVPVAAQSVLFGQATGLAQAALDLKPGPVRLIDAVAEATFTGVQAGAAPPVPVIEDVLDGSAWFRARDLAIDRALLDRILADASQATELDRVSFRVDAASNTANRHQPGVVLVHTDLQADLRDATLNELAVALRSMTPRLDALRYRTLAFHLEARDGMIVRDRNRPLIELNGAMVPGTLPVEGHVRVHWGGDQPLRFRNLLYHALRMIPSRRGP